MSAPFMCKHSTVECDMCRAARLVSNEERIGAARDILGHYYRGLDNLTPGDAWRILDALVLERRKKRVQALDEVQDYIDNLHIGPFGSVARKMITEHIDKLKGR